MKCFVCEKEFEKNTNNNITPIISINITDSENTKLGGPLLFCHFHCFEVSAGKRWYNEISERVQRLAEGLEVE